MLKGILEGIRGILEEGLKSGEVPVLKAHMSSAKAMLDGIITGYTPTLIDKRPFDPTVPLDSEAQAAQEDLR